MADKEIPKADPAEIITGGPAATPDPTPPTPPKLVTVKYGGKDYQVPEDAAQAWDSREKEYNTNFSRQGQELGELRTWRKQIETTVQPKPTEPDLNTLWFENPQEAYKKIKGEIRDEMRGEYQRDQALKSFWDGFYRKNDDLRDDDFLVEAVMQRNMADLVDLPTPRAQDKLAELTRQEILRLTRKTKSDSEPARPRVLVEPASGDRTPKPSADEEEDKGPKSIGAVIKARAQARREARPKVARGA